MLLTEDDVKNLALACKKSCELNPLPSSVYNSGPSIPCHLKDDIAKYSGHDVPVKYNQSLWKNVLQKWQPKEQVSLTIQAAA